MTDPVARPGGDFVMEPPETCFVRRRERSMGDDEEIAVAMHVGIADGE